ncbi:sulfonate ABC transporter ATP-binding protein, partial [Pseudonocardia alni]|nr:sulfonate ABC transporter ATP-binding protein [Pseudonocardia alni]
ELPRPRDVTDPAFQRLRADLLGRLGVHHPQEHT